MIGEKHWQNVSRQKFVNKLRKLFGFTFINAHTNQQQQQQVQFQTFWMVLVDQKVS